LARNCLWSAEKQGFQSEKAGKVMIADHHDQEFGNLISSKKYG
jgi:hypothetical protein